MEVTSHPQPSVVRHTLDTVRVLHDTILTLHHALKDSRKLRTMDDGNTQDVDETADDEEEEEDVFDEGGDKQDSEEDIDDIELVFTTEGTDPSTVNEDFVSIHDGSTRAMQGLVETDISKCGVLDEVDCFRRNTLPAPTPYRPLIHRDVIGAGRGKINCGPLRAVPKAESGAQTDITALPGQWKSENYLAQKFSNLTTLPSKFTLPVPRTSHVPLIDKTREARRVLLSDINFTSMVPELSRSADHLLKEEDASQELCKNYPQAFGYMKSFDVGHDYRSRCEMTRHGSRSSWGSYHGSRCQASSTSIPHSICHCEVPRRRHSWRPPSTPLCCQHSNFPWSSVPSSPTRCSTRVSLIDVARKRVNFRYCYPHVHPGQSLPDLRDIDGDSTDSLIDEAEEYLRHQIDALLIGKRGSRCKRSRRMSDANPATFDPPKSAQPFLPRAPRDLKQGYLVKVITSEGRVVIGKVRYSGVVSGKTDAHVGVQLAAATGVSDGTFLGQRYFQCDEDHAIFVPFNKVVIAWST